MKTILATALLLLMPMLAHATTYHTRMMVDFSPPSEQARLYLFAQNNNDGWLTWTLMGGSYMETVFTTTRNTGTAYDETMRFYGIYSDSTTGYQPMLPDVHVWYDDTAPVMTLHLTNYWPGYHVLSNIGPMFIPGLDEPPITMQWETWATVDATPPSQPDIPAVPEPGTAALLAIGIVSIISASRSSSRVRQI